MCGPAVIPLALMAGGAVVGFVNKRNNAKATEYAGAANQQIAENNADLSDMQADDAITRGYIEEQNMRRATQQRKGEQLAAYAARGIQVDSGSPVDVISDTARVGELDALTVRYNARRESGYYKGVAQNERFAGSVGYQTAKNDARNMRTGAVGSLLSDAGQVAGKWYPKGGSGGGYGSSLSYFDKSTLPARRV